MKPWFLIAALAMLAACASSPEQRAAREKEACASQGLVEGTPEFDNCRIQLHEAAEQRKAQRMDVFDGLEQIRSNHN